LAIDSEGNVYPCNSLYYKLGNIKEDTLESIWNSENVKKIQNIMKIDLNECVDCHLKNLCNRCPGLAYLEDNDIYGCSTIAREQAELKYNYY